ncbi:LacI family transcriptional regulator [Kribbella turkmenica]|uniref:LacI family transcriptional regulator n=1 Tax=Kribbella turkmenica TaxID=2530375 RepID=A0A4R4WHU4_9ACTN|nr:LacI family DNA-binding transcriptional regulator [Kribbella turkmenica]TDD18522.1 LacI family transcriptional regulator [Kribbella turkmenica]
MADLAAHVGVSRQLVSLVLRDAPGASAETRRRVRAAAKELGFSPHVGARSLRRARSKDLGVVFAPAHSTEPEIVEAIYPAASALGYDVMLSAQTSTRSTDEAVDELLGHRCAALVVIGSTVDLRAIARRSHVPVVDVGFGRPNRYYDVVRSSGDLGIEQLVDHLADLGHRGVTYVDPTSMPPGALRRRGYERAVDRRGLTGDLLPVPGDYAAADYFSEAGATAARSLLDRPELPTAVIAPNDDTAVALLHTLIRHGARVPEDLSVAGFDDAPIARTSSVDLTTVRQDPAHLGAAAVRAAVRRVQNPDLHPRETVLDTSLVVRTSTAAPRRPRPRSRTAGQHVESAG